MHCGLFISIYVNTYVDDNDYLINIAHPTNTKIGKWKPEQSREFTSTNVHVSSAHICDYMTTTNLVYTTLTKIHSSRIRTINVKTKTACVAKQDVSLWQKLVQINIKGKFFK